MASTPPSSNSSSIPPKPNNNNHHHWWNNHSKNQHRREDTNCSNSFKPSLASETGACAGGASASASGPSATSGTTPRAFSSSLGSLLRAQKSRLSPKFIGQGSTQFAVNMHFGCPKMSRIIHPHTEVAEEALHCLLRASKNPVSIEKILANFEHRLRRCEDYIYLLKSFGYTGHYLQACECYKISMKEENNRVNKGKLAIVMIETLGKFGEIEHAVRLFEIAKSEGYGNTVHFYSAMISAFGLNRRFHDAICLFRSMNISGLESELSVYNALIDAGAKGKMDFDIIVMFFDEMVANGLVPNQVTYNSLLSACVPKGMWERAQNLLSEMNQKGIDQDLNTYNAYLGALCEGGQMELTMTVMEEMFSRKISPNMVTYSTIMDGYAKANRLEDAQNLYDEMKRRSIGFH